MLVCKSPLCTYVLSLLYWYVNLLYVLMYWVAIIWLAYPLSHDLTGSIVLTSSHSSCRSCLSNWYISITIFVILSPSSLFLTLKILSLSRLFIRCVVSFYLICCSSLMPLFIASARYAVLVALILSVSKVIFSCSCYIKKGLVCVIIASLFGC